MDNNELKPNSHKFRAEQTAADERKKVEKVIKGTAKVKQNELRKFTDVFISEDVKNVKSYVLMDVLVPTIKKAIVDIVTDGVNMIFFGGTGSRKRKTNTDYVSYGRFADRDDRRPMEASRPISRCHYEDIILDSRGEGEAVLNQMDALIETYGCVSVADLYDLIGVTCDYTNNNYGWLNIRNAKVERGRDGYRLVLPKALPLNMK